MHRKCILDANCVILRRLTLNVTFLMMKYLHSRIPLLTWGPHLSNWTLRTRNPGDHTVCPHMILVQWLYADIT